MRSLERGVNCTAERGSGRIRSGRICTLACLILSNKKIKARESMRWVVEKNAEEEETVNESKRRRFKWPLEMEKVVIGFMTGCLHIRDRYDKVPSLCCLSVIEKYYSQFTRPWMNPLNLVELSHTPLHPHPTSSVTYSASGQQDYGHQSMCIKQKHQEKEGSVSL